MQRHELPEWQWSLFAPGLPDISMYHKFLASKNFRSFRSTMEKLILGHLTDRRMGNCPAGDKSVHCYLACYGGIQARRLWVWLHTESWTCLTQEVFVCLILFCLPLSFWVFLGQTFPYQQLSRRLCKHMSRSSGRARTAIEQPSQVVHPLSLTLVSITGSDRKSPFHTRGRLPWSSYTRKLFIFKIKMLVMGVGDLAQ